MGWQYKLSKLKKYYVSILNHLGSCDLCGEQLGHTDLFGQTLSQSLICQSCINDLPFFNQKLITGNLLAWPAIHQALPKISFDRLFALSPYHYPFNYWLTDMKYLGRFEMANLFSALLCAQWRAMDNIHLIAPIDIVIPVPLHLKKWQWRGYNQAHLIAKSFAKELSLIYDTNLVQRVKNNDSQMGKTGTERRKNLANAFILERKDMSLIKHVLLVDDVVTTGSTASEISTLLKAAGVEKVTLVTVCLTLPTKKHKIESLLKA